ncbi:MAG: retron system putative HNH endonuclease [Crocosphaera sp.]
MKHINKQQEPDSLSKYNQKKRQEGNHIVVLFVIYWFQELLIDNTSSQFVSMSILQLSKHYHKIRPKYNKYSPKNDLKISLLKEQGYICCYCLSKIEIDSMSIEHWFPRSKFNVLETEYNNLFGCCKGGGPAKRVKKNRHYCDVAKGDKLISIYPIFPNFETLIMYRSNGEIYSDNQAINKDLQETLNLNISKLVDIRQQKIKTFQQEIANYYSNKDYTIDDLKLLIDQLYPSLEDGEDKYDAYCMVEVGYLRHLINDLEN